MRTCLLLTSISAVVVCLVQAQQPSPPILKSKETQSATKRPSTNAESKEVQINEGDVLRVDANLVTVPIIVIDRQGRYASDLSQDDFQVFEGGVKQEIAFFSPIEQPFSVMLLLDTSASMGDHLGELTRAANIFVSQLRPKDRLTAATFNDSVHLLCDDITVGEVRGSNRLRLRSGKSTHLYDAVAYALRHMRRLQGRKAIVLFSDGADSAIPAFLTDKDNLRAAEEQDALIYTVQFSFPTEPPRNASPKRYVEDVGNIDAYMSGLAERTGGRHFRIEDLSDLAKTFEHIAGELSRQYGLGYYPKAPLEGGQRRYIKVKVNRPDLFVRARDSYVVGRDRR
jgi:Ca-activated chloride channel family protein